MIAKKQKTKYIDPPNSLREKVGFGGIDPLRISRGEEYIDSNEMDFTPYALTVMDRLGVVVGEAKSTESKGRQPIDLITQPIMELKANGGMFGYMLVSEIAGIILNFLENIDELNEDVYGVILAHQNALNVIVMNKLNGSGGKEGRALALELYAVCKRYYKKHEVNPRG